MNEINKTEVELLLEQQKKKLIKIEKEKILLIEGSGEINKFEELKKALYFDDTDNEIKNEIRKTTELSIITEQNINFSILSEEDLLVYCIKNNYTLVRLREYKGKIQEEMLSVLSSYLKDNDMRIQSEANIDCLYILCRFDDLKPNNKGIKRSKRYKKGILPKIILLHKLDDRNTSNIHYKIINEQGEKRPIRNFINSLYKTHTKTTNFSNNVILFSIIFFTILLINTIIMTCSDNLNGFYLSLFISSNPILYYILFTFTLILSCKTFIPVSFDFKYDVSVNSYNDMRYSRWDTISLSNKDRRDYLLFTIYDDFRREYIPNLIKYTIIKNQIFYWCSIFLFLFTFLGIMKLQQAYILDKYNVLVDRIEVIDVLSEDDVPPIIVSDVYKKTGLFTYKKTRVRVQEKIK